MNKYNVGDEVQIKTNLNECEHVAGVVSDMKLFQGHIATITKINRDCYNIDLDNGLWAWNDTMFYDIHKNNTKKIKDWNYALSELEKGEKMRRAHWAKSFYLVKRKDGFIYEIDSNRKWTPKLSSFHGKDWEVYKTEALKDRVGYDSKYSGNIFFLDVKKALYRLKRWNNENLDTINSNLVNKKIDEIWGEEITRLS
jgi:ribosomal protein L21E